MSLRSSPFVTVNAFSQELFGGNPAAVVVVPTGYEFNGDFLKKVSKNFNQPITTFISPPSPNADEKIFEVRFYANEHEPVLCGHGMFAATKAICAGNLPGVNWDPAAGEVKFRTKNGTIVTARTTPGEEGEKDGEWYEIELPANLVQEVSPEDKERVRDAVAKAMGKSPSDLGLEYVGRGSNPLPDYIIIVLNEKENIDGLKVDIPALTATTPFTTNILTQATPGKDWVFVSRMFAPLHGVMEDQVCGSAHTLLVPYWSTKFDKMGEELPVRQVSPRGGNLIVTWDKEREIVKLKGHSTFVARGELLA
ncbi:Diaminopimelate epimerase-like protein [Leucogyrophana mollusca]|uniref:Diaminopimelate epimerase-like protein n=1 Tax=Leucogyrophana mollusca TaxID=85980 RepID=A0ACB8BS62_9AGAM|nr:Diaminopimelate epimerase-like protein [Leucogyrophana mollusca]